MSPIINTKARSKYAAVWPPSWKINMASQLHSVLIDLDEIWYANAKCHADDDGLYLSLTHSFKEKL